MSKRTSSKSARSNLYPCQETSGGYGIQGHPGLHCEPLGGCEPQAGEPLGGHGCGPQTSEDLGGCEPQPGGDLARIGYLALRTT